MIHKLLYTLLFLCSTMMFAVGAAASLTPYVDVRASDALLCDQEGTPPDEEEEEEPDCE